MPLRGKVESQADDAAGIVSMILLLFLMPVSTWRLFSWLVQPAGSGVVRRTLGGEMWGARHLLQVVRVSLETPGAVGLANCSCRLEVEIRAKPLPQRLLSHGRPQVTTQKQLPVFPATADN